MTLAEVTSPEFAEKAAKAIYHVDADSFARHALWCDNSSRSLWPPRYPGYEVEWSGNGAHGYSVMVGQINDRPICITLTLDEIAGQPVLFYDATSQLVDWKMIEEWFEQNLPVPRCDGGRRHAHCDAMNFHHCLDAVREANRLASASAA